MSDWLDLIGFIGLGFLIGEKTGSRRVERQVIEMASACEIIELKKDIQRLREELLKRECHNN
jgi:hypothetical protein